MGRSDILASVPSPYIEFPGQLLAELRAEHGFIEREQLAFAAGLSVKTINRIESDGNHAISRTTFCCLATAFKIAPSDLFKRVAVRAPGRRSDTSARSFQNRQEVSVDKMVRGGLPNLGEAATLRSQVRDTIISYNLRATQDPVIHDVMQQAGRFGEASGLLRLIDRDLKKRVEGIVGLQLKRAAVCLMLGRTGTAKESVRQVFALAPNDIEAQLLDATIDRIEGAFEKAELACANVLRLTTNPAQRQPALVLLGLLQRDRGSLAESKASHLKALALAESNHLTRQAAESHRLLAITVRRQLMRGHQRSAALVKSDLAEARTHWAAGLRLYRGLGDQIGLMNLRDNIAIGHVSVGNLRRARRIFQRLIDEHRALRHRPGQAAAYGNLSMVLGQQGRYKEAVEAAHHASRIFRRIGWVEHLARAQGNIAMCYTLWERKGLAIQHWLRAKRMFEDAGMPEPAEACDGHLRKLNGEDTATPFMA